MSLLASKHVNSLRPRFVASILLGLTAAISPGAGAGAAPVETYVVTDQDGYGVGECLAQKSECGKIVADAWCESHGHGAARAYGPAEDVTAAIPGKGTLPAVPAGATLISCAE
jgi:hypothetical protein